MLTADLINPAAAQVGRIGQHRVDDERLVVVVAAQLEADAVAGHGKRAIDCDSLVAVHLIEHGLLESGGAVGRAENQIAVRVDGGLGAVDLPAYAAGIGAGGDDKVVLQLPLIAVEDQIHAGIDLRKVDPTEGLDGGVPFRRVVADKVTDYAGLRIGSGNGGIGIGAQQLHAQRVSRGDAGLAARRLGWGSHPLPLQVENDFILGEKKRVAGATR